MNVKKSLMSYVVMKPLLLMALSVLLVTACNSSKMQLSNISTEHAANISIPCRVVQNSMGEACVPNDPKRVIVISHRGLLSHALTLGVKPIGSNANTLEDLKKIYLREQSFLGGKIEGIQQVGLPDNPNLEKISLLKPDLILAWAYLKSVYPLLSQIAPTVLIPFDMPDWKDEFNLVAEILGKEAEAQQAWEQYYQRIEELKAALGNRYENRTVSVASTAPSNNYVLVKNSFAGSILNDVGLQRPAVQDVIKPSGGIYNISEERLDILDGDFLFLLYTYDFGEMETYERLKQKPIWKQLKAVKNNQVFLVDFWAWTWNNPSAASAVIDDLYKYLVNTP
ncbi:iron-siderophore ABC transporter substrate-binding protein [Nostoc favosum]|uniref:Iron-siderophore ABC transporter substrate-binding protein n=1 Tax=Nostoc favosum CHAB5714 TaxID=2780399 RepID=A0ABS8IMC8_9NOSO|nr:iron-siderophore ABC transporter substrate-binding protein [Nostoc favosum]MCC5604891.1 iron-siderophore ABC transporter substrate-binding protein [Nostoc favosum CHAB5714]